MITQGAVAGADHSVWPCVIPLYERGFLPIGKDIFLKMRIILILVVLALVAGVVYLDNLDVAPPQTSVEKVIPNERFMQADAE
jgi:hypothetical protein